MLKPPPRLLGRPQAKLSSLTESGVKLLLKYRLGPALAEVTASALRFRAARAHVPSLPRKAYTA